MWLYFTPILPTMVIIFCAFGKFFGGWLEKPYDIPIGTYELVISTIASAFFAFFWPVFLPVALIYLFYPKNGKKSLTNTWREWIRRKACQRKRAFSSAEKANSVMFGTLRGKDCLPDLKWNHVYKCSFGNHYHWGRMRGGEKEGIEIKGALKV